MAELPLLPARVTQTRLAPASADRMAFGLLRAVHWGLQLFRRKASAGKQVKQVQACGAADSELASAKPGGGVDVVV